MIVTMAAALTTAVQTAPAQDASGSDSVPVVSSSALRTVDFTPMTRSERLRGYLTGTFGPGSLAKAAARAGLDQWRDSPKEWGQGGQGFADRLGNAYAKHIIRGTLQYGASSVLHEDDRYLASGQTGFWSRTKYAISSTFLARRDNGGRTFAFARVGSAAGTAFISRTWQPASTSSASHAASGFGFTLAGDLGSNVIREFWPDLKRCFKRN
jgi:hypothetical protein